MSSHNVPQLSPTKQTATSSTKPNRLPAPTLFVGPPSRNASHLSLQRTNTASDGAHKLDRTRSALGRDVVNTSEAHQQNDGTHNNTGGRTAGAAQDGSAAATGPTTRLAKPSEKSLDAKWREMQSTLNEVELTAQSTAHVFGPSHAAALEELRRAQIELARAWGRGNEASRDEDGGGLAGAQSASVGGVDGPGAGAGAGTVGGVGGGEGIAAPAELNVNRFTNTEELVLDRQARNRRRAGTDASASTVLTDESGFSELSGTGRTIAGRSRLEEETAQDIKLGTERRAANEAYFKKVDAGVKDVVAKLEFVAAAMRGVEAESRSLWSGSSDLSRASDEAGAPVKADEEGATQTAAADDGAGLR